jgi:uncharacterized protein YxjI
MGLRDRVRGGGGDARRYQMREKLISIGDDYWIEDDGGDKAFKVDGKAVRFRDTWVLEDASGHEVATIRERKLSVRDAITIELGDRKAVVKKALVGIRDRFEIDVDGGADLKAHGNVVDHEYEIEGHDGTLATVSKKWFRVRDTYGVEVADGADPVLALAITVAIDALAHDHG